VTLSECKVSCPAVANSSHSAGQRRALRSLTSSAGQAKANPPIHFHSNSATAAPSKSKTPRLPPPRPLPNGPCGSAARRHGPRGRERRSCQPGTGRRDAPALHPPRPGTLCQLAATPPARARRRALAPPQPKRIPTGQLPRRAPLSHPHARRRAELPAVTPRCPRSRGSRPPHPQHPRPRV